MFFLAGPVLQNANAISQDSHCLLLKLMKCERLYFMMPHIKIFKRTKLFCPMQGKAVGPDEISLGCFTHMPASSAESCGIWSPSIWAFRRCLSSGKYILCPSSISDQLLYDTSCIMKMFEMLVLKQPWPLIFNKWSQNRVLWRGVQDKTESITRIG